MYEQPDSRPGPDGLPLKTLQTAENFLLLSLRLWAHQYVFSAAASVPDWRSGFEAAGLAGVMQDFDALLGIALSTGRPGPTFRYFACPAANEDECWFLRCATLAQHAQWSALDEALGSRLPVSSRRAVVSRLHQLGKAMRDAGLRLSFFDTVMSGHQSVAGQNPTPSAAVRRLH